MNAREMIEKAAAGARALFEHHRGIIEPIYLAQTPAGTIVFRVPDIDDKDMALALVRRLLAQRQASAYVVCMEAHSLEVPMPKEVKTLEQAMKFIPSVAERAANPDRIEVVYFIAEDKDGEVQASCRIIDDGAGKRTLGPLEFHERPAVSAGRMVGMLPRQPEQGALQ